MFYILAKRHTRTACMTWAVPTRSRLVAGYHHPERPSAPAAALAAAAGQPVSSSSAPR